MPQLKRTPLYPMYASFPDVRCIDFGGWELPVQFTGIQREHEAVRQKAGLFDVSHMGEFIVTGQYAEKFLQQMTTGDVSKLIAGQAQYTLMCDPDGGTVDDLLVYKLSEDQFMLVVNASNIAKDLEWLRSHLIGDVVVEDRSEDTALLALQGPLAASIMSRVTDEQTDRLKPFHFVRKASVCGVPALLSRTGYTGEDGFEIYAPAGEAVKIWTGLLAAGEADGLIPAGLGARDTLRFEAKLALYGRELSASISPLEADLGRFVKLDKEHFIGKEALEKQKREGLRRKLVGIEMIDRGIPRVHYDVYGESGAKIGEVTTGTQSPTLKRNLGLALLDTAYTALGTEVWVDVRGKHLKAQVVKTPFYKRTAAPGEGAPQ